MMDDLPHPDRPWTRTISEEMLSVSETRSRASWMRPSSSSLPYTVDVEVVVDRVRRMSKSRGEAPTTLLVSMELVIVVFVQSISISFAVTRKTRSCWLLCGSGGVCVCDCGLGNTIGLATTNKHMSFLWGSHTIFGVADGVIFRIERVWFAFCSFDRFST